MEKGQLTVRGVLVGCAGCVVLTMSSMYVALKLGALPWPIIFVALVSMCFLRLLGRGGRRATINEVNVTHTIMSAGAMTAGGLAFTMPGLYMLHPDAPLEPGPLLVVIAGGVALGLVFTALFRAYFIETRALPYPMGQAAAETLAAGDEGGRKSAVLFGAFGASGLFTFLRDGIPPLTGRTLFPAAFLSPRLMAAGSLAGVWLSPMLVSVGYIIGPVYIGVWFAGALLGDFGILLGAVKAGWLDGAAAAAAVKSSLGIGLMVGTGAGVIVKGILPRFRDIFGPAFVRGSGGAPAALVLAALAAAFATICGMGLPASLTLIAGAALAAAMSAQVVGQSGINPMEVFAIIVMLAAKAVAALWAPLGDTAAFYAAAAVAIACGLTGDVMNDFKSGRLLKTDPRAQWLGECVGGLVGAGVSLGVFCVIVRAYGPAAFGDPARFPAPQAGMVAAMAGGIPHLPAFLAGLAAALVLYLLNFPVMTLGLGVYLPFYLSATALIGGVVKFVVDKAAGRQGDHGLIVASGALGGEAVVGVVIALCQALRGFAGM